MLKNIIPWTRSVAFLMILFCGFMSAGTAYAQIEKLLDGFVDEFLEYDEGAGAELLNRNLIKRGEVLYLYEQPTIKALSHMYWSLGLYNVLDDEAIDEFMKINECDMYQKFSGDEFEWSGIREAARYFIKNNKSEFPTRFEFMIPLKLREYNERFGAVDVQDEYKIKSFRKFELFASDAYRKPCLKRDKLLNGYPRGIILELSRPLTIIRVPMSKQVANNYIRKVNRAFKIKYKVDIRTKSRMYAMREAYIFLKVKIFAHGTLLGKSGNSRLAMVGMMGILEGYEIYADRKKETLFYSQIYVRGKTKGRLDIRLGDQYKILEEKSKNGGLLR
ncbi:MAG: hypothetical protein COB14_06850 [Alphaproteobacteria bacterium]|nr:MAG: hypothetical protein COB14_06850 [Alphaproteobacteria bacterium]